jgi:hypothetical protein
MPPRSHVVRVQPHTVDHGLWCASCLLPSVLRIALLNVDTLNVLSRYDWCDECGRQERVW